MKKSLVSALAALAMVVGGVAPAAHAAITGFAAVPGQTSGSIDITWDAVAGTDYTIKWCSTTSSQGGCSYGNPGVTGLTTGSHTLTGLATTSGASTLYYFFGIWSYVGGNMVNVYDHFTATPAFVGAPSNISQQSLNSAGALGATWTGATNATGYEVSYSTSNNSGWSSPNTITQMMPGMPPSTMTQFSGLSTSSNYYVRVVPKYGSTVYPAVVSSTAFTPSAGPQPLAAPQGFTVTSPLSGRLALSWNAVPMGGGYAQGYVVYLGSSSTGPWVQAATTFATSYTISNLNPTIATYVKVVARDNQMNEGTGAVSAAVTPNGGVQLNNQVVVVTPVAPVVPVFKQPKFAMPSKIDVDTTGKVSLSGKDMGVSTVLIGGKEQKIDTNSDEKLVFDTTGLAKGVHDLVMKGAFGTYTIQKAIQVGEAVVTKVAAVSARQVGMAGGELSISGQGLEGTTQITMNGQVLEIVSRTDSKVTFKVPASTVASVNSIMIEGSFVPVIFKNAFSYTK